MAKTFIKLILMMMYFNCMLLIAALRNAKCDVIALQEVYEEWQADFLTESLRISYPFTARRTSGGAFSLHNGLMILSRFPVLHTLFHPFHSVRNWK